MNTVKSLQALYVKLGGNLTDTYSGIAGGIPVGDYSLIPDMIQACTQKAGSGGGGTESLKVEFTLNGETPEPSKTVREINEAYEAGKTVFGVFNSEGVDYVLPLQMAGLGDSGGAAQFSAIINAELGSFMVMTFAGILEIEGSTETETWTRDVGTIQLES